MKKAIAWLLILSFGTFPTLLLAERRGAELRILKGDYTYSRGELIYVKEDSLVLLDSDSGAEETLKIQDIRMITFLKKSKIGLVSIGGFLVGGALGASLGANANNSDDKDLTLMFGVIGAVTVGIFSGLAAKSLTKEKKVSLEGITEAEKSRLLEDLRAKARVLE